MNLKLLFLTILALLFGYNVEPQPVRLAKKETLTLREKINNWIHIHRYEILLTITIIVVVTGVVILFLAIGSATESGNMYNHMQDVI